MSNHQKKKKKVEKTDYKLNKENKFVTHYGTAMNERRPSVVYLRTKSKITPIVEKKDYDQDVTIVKRKFARFVDNCVRNNKFVRDNYLFKIDISNKSVKFGKVSFLRYDIYLKPVNAAPLDENYDKFKEISMELDGKLESLLNENNMVCN